VAAGSRTATAAAAADTTPVSAAGMAATTAVATATATDFTASFASTGCGLRRRPTRTAEAPRSPAWATYRASSGFGCGVIPSAFLTTPPLAASVLPPSPGTVQETISAIGAHFIQVTTSFLYTKPDRPWEAIVLRGSFKIRVQLDTYECTIMHNRCGSICNRLY